jgi:zinc protease
VGDLPVVERTLANGFKALVVPRPRAPVVVCDLYYPVGSVDEPAGRSGIAHFVEHMLFKGTERLPKGQVDRLAFLAAGQLNAETGEDSTRYWFALPRDRWELALAVEADRMRGAIFEPAEVEAERYVIAEERARELDSPLGRLDQMHLALSYLVHPYRNPVLGWPEDLRRTTVGELRDFYELHYRPDGAVLILVGALDPERALDRVEQAFGGIARGDRHRQPPAIDEPRQTGRRDFTLVESDSVARGILGWHTVPIGHADEPALDVFSDLLCCGRRSRLWDALVERARLATWVDAAQEGSRLAGQFLIQVEAAPGSEPARIEECIRATIARLAEEGPTADELVRSRHRLEAARRWEQEDAGGLATGLGQVALWRDWRDWQEDHRAALAVTADDIRRVGSAYPVDLGLTVGWSLPRPPRVLAVLPDVPAEPAPARPAPAPAVERPLAFDVPAGAPALADYRPRREILPCGLRVLTERRAGTGTVALELYIDAGQLREAKPGVAYLTGRLREEGTRSRAADVLAGAVEDIGGTLEISATGASLRMRAEDLALAVELLADVARRPAFPADAFDWVKRRVAAELHADRDDPAFRAELVFRALVYGDHPYARDPRGTAREIAALTRDDVRAHHARHHAPDRSCLVAVGDFDTQRLRALVRRQFGDWARGRSRGRVPPAPVRGRRPRVRRIVQPGQQVHILLGHLGIARDHADFAALAVLDHILGTGPGFTDRLSRRLRDELGLAYSVGGGITDSADVVPGVFRIYIGTRPDEADRAVAAALGQVEAIWRGEFGDDEVDRARQYLAGAWVFDFQTVAQRAERLLELERWGLPLDEPVRWPQRVEEVTADMVRAAARRHIDPRALVRVEYGPLKGRGQMDS